jgi:uncharacterized protein Usg
MNAVPYLFNWYAFSTRQVRLPILCQQLRRNAASALNLEAKFIRPRLPQPTNDEKLGSSRTWRFAWPRKIFRSRNILYRRPDHPWLLQTYVWQNYDLYPDFPELQGFLEFWQKSLEGVLHSVTVAHSRLIKPAEIKLVDGVFRLH